MSIINNRMDDSSIYQQILDFISLYLPQTTEIERERRISAFLSDTGMVFAYFWITASFLWLTTKSVLLRRTALLYLIAASIFFCGMAHLGRVIGYPFYFQLALDFIGTSTSIVTAIVAHRQRHCILSVVYQFKYVIGLLKNMEKIDEVESS